MGVCWVMYMGQQLGRLLVSCPAGHSVTPRCSLSHFAFLAFLDFQRVLNVRSLCNYAQTTPILTQAKLGKTFETIRAKQCLVQRLQIFRPWAQLGIKYRFCMGRTDRPLRTTNFDTILSCLMLWEWKSIDVSRKLLPVKIAVP
jgi:hypothetical protein